MEIDGKEYLINSDFRVCLAVILAFEDPELTGYEKQTVMLRNLYQVIPADTQAALSQANKFLNGGKVSEEEDEDAPAPCLYSFSKDADFIFSAFRQTHGIDLETTDMHWFKFMALFMDLGQDTTFCQLVGLRKRIKTGKATKEERAAASEMGDLIDIPEPDTRTLGEKEAEAEFLRLVGEGQGKPRAG